MTTTQTTSPEQSYAELAASPHAFDAKLADAYDEWQKATDVRDRIRDAIYRAAGYKKTWEGRRQVWLRPFSEALQGLQAIANPVDADGYPAECPPASIRGRELLAQYGANEIRIAEAALVVHQMEAVYDKAPWTRYFPCTNRDGHIHSSYRGCPTVRWDTLMAWRPDLSGLTVDEAVQMPPKGLGPALCSVCFPLAPVEQRSMTTGQVADELTRAERDAARDARQAARDAKQLTQAESDYMGRVGTFSERVTTVAKLKEVVRKAIELEVEAEYWAARSPEGWTAEQIARRQANLAADLAKAQQDATRAAYVLIARETRHEGWGANEGQITKMRSNKRKSARKEWGLA